MMTKQEEYLIKHAAFSNPEAEPDNDTFVELLERVSKFLLPRWPCYVQDISFSRDIESLRGYDSPTAVVYYNDQTKEMLDFAVDVKQRSLDDRISEALPERELIEGQPFNCLTVRLPQGLDQDNIPLLLKNAADAIREIDDVKIRHIFYGDFTDDDAINNPYIIAYYENNEES